MLPVSFHVRAWAGWKSGCSPPENAGAVPALLRRRVTPLGRQTLSAAWGLLETAKARMVFASRHGEFSRTLSLLDAVVNRADLSPADFTLSVHHALPSLLSIAQGNPHGHTAVAAGTESFCFGLMEALACLKENPDEPVVFLHCDEPLPEPYTIFNEAEDQPIILAMSLGLTGEGEPIRFTMEPVPPHEARPAPHALNFLNFLTSGAREGCSLDTHRQWRWARHALA